MEDSENSPSNGDICQHFLFIDFFLWVFIRRFCLNPLKRSWSFLLPIRFAFPSKFWAPNPKRHNCNFLSRVVPNIFFVKRAFKGWHDECENCITDHPIGGQSISTKNCEHMFFFGIFVLHNWKLDDRFFSQMFSKIWGLSSEIILHFKGTILGLCFTWVLMLQFIHQGPLMCGFPATYPTVSNWLFSRLTPVYPFSLASVSVWVLFSFLQLLPAHPYILKKARCQMPLTSNFTGCHGSTEPNDIRLKFMPSHMVKHLQRLLPTLHSYSSTHGTGGAHNWKLEMCNMHHCKET